MLVPIVEIQHRKLLSRNRFDCRNEVSQLYQFVDKECYGIVVLISHRQISDEVERDMIPPELWNLQRLRQASGYMMSRLVVQSRAARSNEFDDVASQVRPPEEAFDCLASLLHTRVSSRWSVMELLQNQSCQIFVIWDIHLVVLQEETLRVDTQSS